MIRRGDVVVVDFPFTDIGQSKVRPALVIQNDRDNQKIRKTVIAMITGKTRRRGDPSHPEGAVEPGIPTVLDDPAHPFRVAPPPPGAKTTGRRRALAEWLTRPDNPLSVMTSVSTARPRLFQP